MVETDDILAVVDEAPEESDELRDERIDSVSGMLDTADETSSKPKSLNE